MVIDRWSCRKEKRIDENPYVKGPSGSKWGKSKRAAVAFGSTFRSRLFEFVQGNPTSKLY